MIDNQIKKDPRQIKRLIPLRANSEELLSDIAKQHKYILDNNNEVSLQDVYHLCSAFKHEHPIRCVIKAHSSEDYCAKLNDLINGKNHKEIFISNTKHEIPARVVFVYSGMGPQWWGMGRDLYKHYDVFKTVIDKCENLINKCAGWSLLNEMFRPEDSSNMSQTWLAQPANFALQAGLTELWKTWGVTPNCVVGHSIGETTAFYVAGVHTFEEALLINLHRGRLQHKLIGQGKMLAVGLNEFEIRSYIHNEDQVRLAAINSNSSVTLAGEESCLHKIFEALPDNIFKKYLTVNIPYHGHCMEQIKAELEYELSSIRFAKGNHIKLYSSVTGKSWNENLSPVQYWWKNTFDTVHFKSVSEDIIRNGNNIFVEIGPHKALLPSLKETATNFSSPCCFMSSLNKGTNEIETLQKSLSSIFCSGVNVNWEKYNKDLSDAMLIVDKINYQTPN